jgi:hypothetical protein
MNEQKFHHGDLVHIAKDLGFMMKHFTSDVDAIVIASYADQFGGGNTKDYTLHIKGRGRSSWYHEHQLTLLERGRQDLLKSWEDVAKAESQIKSDLDWIFANGQEVLTKPHSASIFALAECFGLTDLWGRRGEGITYFGNTMFTLEQAEPFLKTGDKTGWMARCEFIKSKIKASHDKDDL